MHKITEIKGLSEENVAKLKGLSIDTAEELLEKARSTQQRTELSKQIGVDTKDILEWVNRADLMRLKGVGTEFANLLEEAGVDTCKELARRKPENLLAKLTEVNEAKSVTKRLPKLEDVEAWVKEAAELGATGPTY